MARYANKSNGYQGVNWGGIDPDIIGFRDELATLFPTLVVTSASRSGGGVGKAGKSSRHNKGQALDLAADPSIQKFLYSAKGDALLRKYNLGFLDESIDEVRKKTGGTGPHFHIGKDSTLSGNQNSNNTAFNREKHEGHVHDEQGNEVSMEDPNNVSKAYDQTNTGNTEFIQQLVEQNKLQQEQLSKQYEAEKASIARQNAIQERVKEKMESQVQIMELIQGHDLDSGISTPTRSLEEGGEFLGLSNNLQYKIDAIKAQIPDAVTINPKDSETYRKLQQTIEEAGGLRELMLRNNTPPYKYDPEYTGPRMEPKDYEITEETQKNGEVSQAEPSDTAGKLFKKLSSLGLAKHQVSGVLGSLSGESHFALDSKAKNATSGATGIAQWLGSRLTGLKEFGKSMGRDYKNEDIQIEYLLHELQNTSEKRVMASLKKAKTLEEATAIWTRQFERPSEKEIQKSMEKRIKNARIFEKKFS